MAGDALTHLSLDMTVVVSTSWSRSIHIIWWRKNRAHGPGQYILSGGGRIELMVQVNTYYLVEEE